MTNTNLSELAQAAVALNELYLTLQQAGFTEKEALYLTGQGMFGNPNGGQQ